MKALELTVHPYWVDELSGTAYADREGLTFPINVDYWVLCKRLKEEEMAAEVWHSIVRFNSLCPSREAAEEARRNAVIERFATLPHYDEVSL